MLPIGTEGRRNKYCPGDRRVLPVWWVRYRNRDIDNKSLFGMRRNVEPSFQFCGRNVKSRPCISQKMRYSSFHMSRASPLLQGYCRQYSSPASVCPSEIVRAITRIFPLKSLKLDWNIPLVNISNKFNHGYSSSLDMRIMGREPILTFFGIPEVIFKWDDTVGPFYLFAWYKWRVFIEFQCLYVCQFEWYMRVCNERWLWIQ